MFGVCVMMLSLIQNVLSVSESFVFVFVSASSSFDCTASRCTAVIAQFCQQMSLMSPSVLLSHIIPVVPHFLTLILVF